MKSMPDLAQALQNATDIQTLREDLQARLKAPYLPGAAAQAPNLVERNRPILSWFRKPTSPFDVTPKQVNGWLNDVVQSHPPHFPQQERSVRGADTSSEISAPGGELRNAAVPPVPGRDDYR